MGMIANIKDYRKRYPQPEGMETVAYLYFAQNDIQPSNKFLKFKNKLHDIYNNESAHYHSFNSAENFILKIYKQGLPLPIMEVYPQRYVAYTWRKERTGILNIAFNEKGTATYIAYLGDNENAIKGEFSTAIPQEIISLIHQITGV